jgi:hypothetical protein
MVSEPDEAALLWVEDLSLQTVFSSSKYVQLYRRSMLYMVVGKEFALQVKLLISATIF